MNLELKSIIDYMKKYAKLDAIIVEGYDGVGKGKLLSELSEYLGVKPYRPDYNLWQKFDHRAIDRWKVSGFFWDIYSHFDIHNEVPMLFDRGVISGAVYNNDLSIAEHYREMLRDSKVIHVLVVCDSIQDYVKFLKARNPDISDEDILEEVRLYPLYTDKYIEALNISGVDYIIYNNKYDESVSVDRCSSCGHYSYGICRHPSKNCLVDGDSVRCELSKDKEVQDLDDSEMYSLQS